jgi:hypothetical protein
MASDIAKRNFDKQAERYSQMSSDDLMLLSADLSQLTGIAQKTLMMEIAKRGLKESKPILERTNLSPPRGEIAKTTESPIWDYEKMSDEELEQLCAAYQKLHKPISNSLRSELDARESRRTQTAVVTSSPQTQIGPTTQSTSATPETTEATQVVSSAKGASAPYARFTVQSLIFCLCTSVGVFAFFDALARNTTAFVVEAVSIVLSLFMGWIVWKTWKNILKSESQNELKFKHRVRNALVTSLVFFFLYLGLAALLGSIIGQNRAEAAQFNFDIENQKELAARITKARSAVSDTIPSYLAMYAGIESDVNKYSTALLRLRNELPVYNSKFPNEAAAMQKYSNTIEREIRRSDLLKKQIAAAKQIALLYEYQQGPAWRSEMLPILEAEDALDKSK